MLASKDLSSFKSASLTQESEFQRRDLKNFSLISANSMRIPREIVKEQALACPYARTLSSRWEGQSK